MEPTYSVVLAASAFRRATFFIVPRPQPCLVEGHVFLDGGPIFLALFCSLDVCFSVLRVFAMFSLAL